MANYLNDNLNQSVFFDLNYLEVLGKNTFEHCLYQLLTHHLDLSCFDACYKNSGVGRKAYPPALLLRIIFYAYYRGITSSRVIEHSCKTDLKFIALCGGRQPHFTTIANFVSGYTEQIKDVFHKVLMVCCDSGLVGKEHFAIDGCKLPSDASKQWSGTHADLKKKADKLRRSANKIIERHKSCDNDKHSENKERELQTIDTLTQSAEKIEKFLAENEKRMGVGKRKNEVQSNITDNDSTKMTTSKGTIQGYNCQTVSDEKHQIVIATEACGVGQDQSLLKPMVDHIRKNLGEDILDKDVLLTADTGYSSESNMELIFKEEINAIIPDNNFRQRDPRFTESDTVKKHKEHRQKTRPDRKESKIIFSSSDFEYEPETNTCICPNGKELLFRGDHFEVNKRRTARFIARLTDCRACPLQSRCMKKPVNKQGRQVSFPLCNKNTVSYLDLMKQKIDSEEGRRNYSRRMWTIEPVFANITSNKGIKRLTLRGKAKVTCQWTLCCIVHNLEKLWRYGEKVGNMAV